MNTTTPTPAPAAHGHDPHDAPEAAPARPSFLRLAIIAVLALGALGALGVAGVRARNQQLTERTEAATAMHTDRPRVLTATAERAPARVEQVLPASAAPWRESPLFARTTGYLKGWKVDRGDVVKEGQLLAEIETPEVDAQLLQTRAALAESRATLVRNKASAELARVNLDRIRQSYERGVSSRQDFDEADAALKVALATVQVSDATIQANEANVNRLETLQSFQKVVAPFAGVITARNYDSGALVVADSSGGREIFHIAAIDTLRVQADVPQTFATSVKVGQVAPVSRREVPGKEYAGSVGRTTQAVNVQTRTLRVEVDVPNPDHALLPGMYLQVRFQFDSPNSIVRVPGAAVVIRAEGAKVAIIEDDGKVNYRPVKLGRDFGTVVEVMEGLKGGERLVVRPGDDLAPGTYVEAVTAGSK